MDWMRQRLLMAGLEEEEEKVTHHISIQGNLVQRSSHAATLETLGWIGSNENVCGRNG
jgi:hypothetical protein